MANGIKDNMVVTRKAVVVRVPMPRKTYRALKIKCALMDITVRQGMTDLVKDWVKDIEKDIASKDRLRGTPK